MKADRMTGRIPDVPRIASPTKLRDGATILDIDHYAPFLLSAVGNAWLRKTSAIYRSRFDISIGEWRVLSMLNIEPGITANRICEVIRMDKAAASRSLRLLSAMGCLRYEATPSDTRKRRWWLTEDGLRLHDQILAIALECESEMVSGLAPDELEICLGALRRMLANFD